MLDLSCSTQALAGKKCNNEERLSILIHVESKNRSRKHFWRFLLFSFNNMKSSKRKVSEQDVESEVANAGRKQKKSANNNSESTSTTSSLSAYLEDEDFKTKFSDAFRWVFEVRAVLSVNCVFILYICLFSVVKI